MMQRLLTPARQARRRAGLRRGFNLPEMLIALAVSGALLTATLAALDASFKAYQTTTEMASTHTISRLIMHRMQTMIRTGWDFYPRPVSPQDQVVESNWLEFRMPPTDADPDGAVIGFVWIPDATSGGTLYLVNGHVVATEDDPMGSYHQILDHVVPQSARPFTLEYELGTYLNRATIDLVVEPDDDMSVQLDGDHTEQIRLVASVMPRSAAY